MNSRAFLRRVLWLPKLAPFVLLGCRDEPLASSAHSKSVSSTHTPKENRGIAIAIQAEQRRSIEPITSELFHSRDERVRVAAARAAARIGLAKDRLLSALADESPDVVRWAAFGLGRDCTPRDSDLTQALSLRAAALLSEQGPASAALPVLADALGRCATPEAERTLRAWLALEKPIAEASAFALGKLAATAGKLEEASWIALLEAAEKKTQAVEAALYAFTRLAPPEGALRERALEVLSRTAREPSSRQSLAVRALGRLGAEGAEPLSEALRVSTSNPAIGAEIARELGRLGRPGQAALSEALQARAGQAASFDLKTTPGEPDVLLGLLEALSSVSPKTRLALATLAKLDLPESKRDTRRIVELRCSAARLLAGRSANHAALRSCDPDPVGLTGRLALLSVLDRGKLEGVRAKQFRALFRDTHPLVRRQAIGILPGHRELRDLSEILARALGDPSPGVVASAAEVLAKHPDRAALPPNSAPAETSEAQEQPPTLRPESKLIQALAQALRIAEKKTSIEVHASLLDATAALSVLSLNAELEQACRSDNATLRERAQRARRILSATASACKQGTAPQLPAELERIVDRSLRLTFETDAGPLWLELEPKDAPVAVTRLRDLARSGFYDGTSVHRAVPGFLVQLGDPIGDGFGGSPRPPLRCELSPDPFDAGSVGVAVSGRDTGNSQFFVTFARFPHLDGEITRVGRAGPGWERLRVGDRITKVHVE